MAMRGTSTQLECGPILFACKVYAAHETVKDGMTNTHTACGGKLNERKWCAACEKEVLAADITKAYALNTKTLVPLAEDEIASLPVKSTKEIEVVQFFKGPLDDRYYGEHLYYIGPDGKPKAYQLLLTAMEKAKVKAVARFKKSLYIIEPCNGVLTMREIVYADNFREPGEIRLGIEQAMKKVAIGEKEQAAVGQLVAGMAKDDLDLSEYTNAYTEALEKLVEAKLEGKVATMAPAAEAKPTSDDGLADAIMAYLGKSKAEEDRQLHDKLAKHGGVVIIEQPAGETVPLVVDQTPEPADAEEVVLPW